MLTTNIKSKCADYPRVTVGPENPIRVERDETAELYCEVPILNIIPITACFYSSPLLVTLHSPGGQQAVGAGGALGARREVCPDPVPPPHTSSQPQRCRTLHLQC